MKKIIVKKMSKKVPNWPHTDEVQQALLLVLNVSGGSIVFSGNQKDRLLTSLADYFGLKVWERRLPHITAGTVWSNLVQWSKFELVKKGVLVKDSPRCVWAIKDYKEPKPMKARKIAS